MGQKYRRDIMPSQRDRACGRKQRHRTREDALKHLRSLATKEQNETEAYRTGKGLNIYRCWYCSFWHVGHTKRTIRNKDRTFISDW